MAEIKNKDTKLLFPYDLMCPHCGQRSSIFRETYGFVINIKTQNVWKRKFNTEHQLVCEKCFQELVEKYVD